MREVFLSYHHDDRKLAARLKKELVRYGLRAFLAHEDIAVSSQWRREIVRHLNSCIAIVAVVTRSFYKSDWTCQEMGIAMGKEKTIISLILDDGINPWIHGVISTYPQFEKFFGGRTTSGSECLGCS